MGAWIEIFIGFREQFPQMVVAPFAGAWIEINNRTMEVTAENVAPFAGAWIEIFRKSTDRNAAWVAPFAGAWIEICGREKVEK